MGGWDEDALERRGGWQLGRWKVEAVLSDDRLH